MKQILFFVATIFILSNVDGQSQDTNQYINSSQRLLQQNKGLTLGGYAQIDYNQPFGNDMHENGTLDVHRLVMLLGYNFSDRLQFVSEIEFEHVEEVFVEQAFIQYQFNSYLNFRGGLLLIPMGIVNEYHEPNTFNGVERPYSDTYIAPTTWRELGFGVSGNIIVASLKYQAYIVNGFNGYDGNAKLSGANGFRKGRQKGAESYISSPNFTAKVEYYGIRGLNIGLSTYLGKTQTTAIDGVSNSDASSIAFADSTVVDLAMLGLDFRYLYKGIEARGQMYYSSIANTEQYNQALNSDLGSEMMSYYIELGYNVLKPFRKFNAQLIPFVRYENYNTHHGVSGTIIKNEAFDRQVITAGLTWKLNPNVALKTDLQWINNKANTTYLKAFNAGIGLMF